MNTTMEKVNVKELADQVLDNKSSLEDSKGLTLTYTYDPITDKGDKADKIDTGNGNNN
ncbi:MULTISPECIES: hypothetical protein [Lactobacillus]|uniref:hypothetical protein n=1 Tax=Lactobacillus TaxID=1578 RepID=UPI0013747E51|nr:MULTISPECIES: hypothetical protein [Lactobacillus]